MLVARREIRIREDVELANVSDVGCEREQNEDYFLYAEPQDDAEFARRGRLIIVADGMGGRNGGEVASRLAVETIRIHFFESETDDPRAVLIAAFQAAHEAILREARQTPELHGMGTTCCAAILKAGRLYFGHVGDSRIYLIRGGHAQRLTEDHSLVARMVRDGLITEEQAQTHESKNVLTAALGFESELLSGDFSADPLPLLNGDIIALCSDGLHNLVSDRELALTMEDQSLTEASRELVARAKIRGAPDNVTVQLLKVKGVEA